MREKAAARRSEVAARRAKVKGTGDGPRGDRKPAVGRRGERKPPSRRRRPPARARVLASRARFAEGAKRARSQARPAARSAATRITAFGERASKLIRGAAAPVVAALLALALLGRRGLARLAVAVTPLRAVIAVTGIAAILLAVSQFVDYRGVAVGVDDYAVYSDVEPVAPAPQVDRRAAGEPHSYLLVPLAVVALALLVASVRGRWQLGRVISLLGLGALAVSILVDVPAGLDEGEQAIAYASVEAQLLEGFYVQVVCAGVLVIGGLLVSRYARPARRPTRTRRRRATVGRLGARTA